MTPCKFEGCDRPGKSKGWCKGHYSQQYHGLEMKPLRPAPGTPYAVCSFDGCGRLMSAKGLCQSHRAQQRAGKVLVPLLEYKSKKGKPCEAGDCDRPIEFGDFCGTHYAQWRRIGRTQPIHVPQRRFVTPQGYVMVTDPSHPNCDKRGRLMEHVAVMSEMLGRPLVRGENVHHINGVKDDNRPENLELWSTSQPKGQRVADKVAWAREVLALYGEEMEQHPEALGAR